MKNILVPFDYSKEAITGLNTAVNFSNRYGGKINLVNFVVNNERIFDPYSMNSSLEKEELSHDQVLVKQSHYVLKKLDETMKTYVPKPKRGSVFTVLDSLSNLWNEILDVCQPDLIISGTSGTRNFSEFFWGNSTETMLRHSEIPILAVSDSEDMQIERILLATDVGKVLPQKMINLCKIFSKLRTEIHFASIINVDVLTKEKVEQKIALLAKEYGIDRYQIHTRLNMNIKDGILEIAQEITPDIIMMKTYEKSPFWQLVQKSIAEDVIKSTDIPTMIEKVKR